MNKAIEITDTNFDDIIKTSQPVLIDFWAEWCGPCKMISPVVEELAQELDGIAVIGKINVDDNPVITSRFGIRSIPTLLIFQNGEVVDKQIGVIPKSILKTKVRNYINE